MSDKTKRMRDDARIKQRYDELAARDAQRPKFEPKCHCGAPPAWVVNGRWRWDVSYFCDAHMPSTLLDR